MKELLVRQQHFFGSEFSRLQGKLGVDYPPNHAVHTVFDMLGFEVRNMEQSAHVLRLQYILAIAEEELPRPVFIKLSGIVDEVNMRCEFQMNFQKR